ncbi:HNH endonuclease signature motif containing protein [Dactylosporangium sp. NPDC050588]|uniref:HNH endonuclease signature motif containing protein n=1 Tax=Dactylosporangium sp. NPDC050588 TaxID=3157211 RepID=UPI0033ECB27F
MRCQRRASGRSHRPSRQRRTDHVSNGLLLRADLHNLFDKTLIWVDGRNHVRVDPRLKNSEYAEFDGVLLRQPSGSASRPDKEALRRHRERSLSSS